MSARQTTRPNRPAAHAGAAPTPASTPLLFCLLLWPLTAPEPFVRVQADEFPPDRGRANLALGKPVIYLPEPNYPLTARGNSDPLDLTDGRTSARPDRHIWFDAGAVAWSYAGRVNLALDLGTLARIDEVAIRLLGGSPQAGVSFPGWIELLVSTDGEHFVRVAQCSRWRSGDFRRYGVPPETGKAWIHCLRFADLDVVARWVAIRMYTGGLSASDELYVFGKPLEDPIDTAPPPAQSRGEMTGFTVRHPQVYFHKPRIQIATNLPLPTPIGILVPVQERSEAVELVLELPPEVHLVAGSLANASAEQLPNGPAGGRRRYRFRFRATTTTKVLGRLYLQAAGWPHGGRGRLRYRFRCRHWQSPWLTVPVEAVLVPRARQPQRLMVGLGWWSIDATMRWPNVLEVWQHLGINTFPIFARWMRAGHAGWPLVEEARRRGFRILHIDSPFHHLLNRRKDERQIYDQLGDGRTGSRLCISYRGRFYREELELFAQAVARARPDFVSLDIELWSWRGPVDARRCRRCREDFEASGLTSWEEWFVSKGEEIWRDLVTAARDALDRRRIQPRFEIGGYDFRPGTAYQNVWPFDRLYPEWLQSGQVSTYTCLYPYHLALIGDEVRQDRLKLPRSDLLPWITPGDAGTFPGEAFQWALLECYCNGARGVYFWSGRVWDAESLIALNRVVRALAPVERVILEGRPVQGEAQVVGPGRVVGMARGNEMVLLVADYGRASNGSVRLRLRLKHKARVMDLMAARGLLVCSAGEQTVTIELAGDRAKLLWVRPARVRPSR